MFEGTAFSALVLLNGELVPSNISFKSFKTLPNNLLP
jgi:hypothetical protein